MFASVNLQCLNDTTLEGAPKGHVVMNWPFLTPSIMIRRSILDFSQNDQKQEGSVEFERSTF